MTFPTPKKIPYLGGCTQCPVAQYNTMWQQDELGVRTSIGWQMSCRELNNKIVEDYSECPIIELGYFQREELFDKYEHTQGEN